MSTKDTLGYRNLPLHKIPEYWASFKPTENITATKEEEWKTKVEFLDNLSVYKNVVIYLINTYTNRFVYINDKTNILAGLSPELFMAENGLEFSISRLHPDHVEASLKLTQIGLNFYADSSLSDYKNIALNQNYLYKNGQDEYVQLLQQGMILEVDDSGRPALSIWLVHKVGHIKKADSAALVITSPSVVQLYSYNRQQNIIEAPKTFSDQERKIISLLAQGDDTKTIAQKLFISAHTVDTHRRNLIKKAECRDTTGVVDFARLINLI